MLDTDSSRKIKEKILKLLEMGKSLYQGEAENAMNAALKLMLEHNITKNDLDIKDDYIKINLCPSSKKEISESAFIMSILKDFFNVAPSLTKSKSKTEYFVYGSKSDCEISIYIFNHLVTLYKNLFKTSGETKRLEYYLGLTKAIVKNLEDTKIRTENEWGVIIVADQNIVKYTESLRHRTKKIKSSENQSALRKGLDDGQKVIINKAINNKKFINESNND